MRINSFQHLHNHYLHNKSSRLSFIHSVSVRSSNSPNVVFPFWGEFMSLGISLNPNKHPNDLRIVEFPAVPVKCCL